MLTMHFVHLDNALTKHSYVLGGYPPREGCSYDRFRRRELE